MLVLSCGVDFLVENSSWVEWVVRVRIRRFNDIVVIDRLREVKKNNR